MKGSGNQWGADSQDATEWAEGPGHGSLEDRDSRWDALTDFLHDLEKTASFMATVNRPSIWFVQATLGELFFWVRWPWATRESTGWLFSWVIPQSPYPQRDRWEEDFRIFVYPLNQKGRVQELQEATLWGGTLVGCFWAQEPIPPIPSFMGPSPFLLLSLPCQQTLRSSRGKVQNESNSFYFLWCFQRCKKCHAFQCARVVGKMSVPGRGASSPQLLWRWVIFMLLSFGARLDSATCGKWQR